MFSPCVFVCGCLWLSRCLSGRFNYEGLVPHKQYFAGTLFGMSSCASYVSAFITSLMTSQDHKVGQILKLIYLRNYLSYSVNQKLKMSEMLMAIFLVYSTSGTTSGNKVCRELKMAAIKHSFNLTSDMEISSQIMPKKGIFMMMTSSMTSQGGLKVDPLYSFMNEITTFFMITIKQAKISWLNFLCVDIMRLWLQLYKHILMTSLMTSPGRKIGQILKLIYFRLYLS